MDHLGSTFSTQDRARLSNASWIPQCSRFYTEKYASIVAVHGLGANPKWAWMRKVKVDATNKEQTVNWLADDDLLPNNLQQGVFNKTFECNMLIVQSGYKELWNSKIMQLVYIRCSISFDLAIMF